MRAGIRIAAVVAIAGIVALGVWYVFVPRHKGSFRATVGACTHLIDLPKSLQSEHRDQLWAGSFETPPALYDQREGEVRYYGSAFGITSYEFVPDGGGKPVPMQPFRGGVECGGQ